jgi:hypothetical protein
MTRLPLRPILNLRTAVASRWLDSATVLAKLKSAPCGCSDVGLDRPAFVDDLLHLVTRRPGGSLN